MNLPMQVMRGKKVFTSGILVNLIGHAPEANSLFYEEADFRRMLAIESMRAQRCKKPFGLLLINVSQLMLQHEREKILDRIKTALTACVREIDTLGWFHDRRTLGIIFTEVTVQQNTSIEFIIRKIYDPLCKALHLDLINKIEISFHLFPKVNSGSANIETRLS